MKKIIFLAITRLISTFRPSGCFFCLFWKNRLFAHNLVIINISKEWTLFRNHFGKIVPLFIKGCFYESTIKKSFFGHNSLSINISNKSTLIWDHFEQTVFWPYFRKHKHFEKNKVFLPIFPKKITLL